MEANEEVELYVNIIPGSPEPFHKSLRLQVAHFEPHSIDIKGQGVFPRLVLDLPRRYTEPEQRVLEEARQILVKRHEAKNDDKNSISFLDMGAAGEDKKLEVVRDRVIFIVNVKCFLFYYFCDSRNIIETSRCQLFFSKSFVVILKNSDILFGSYYKREI